MSARVLSAVLTHQDSHAAQALLKWWSNYVDPHNVLVVYAGPETEFCRLKHSLKVRVVDERLRTRDHQRELQSYGSVFRAIAKGLSQGDWEYVNFSEYDQLPLQRGADAERIHRLTDKSADVLGYQLRRVDDTNHPHWLYYQAHVPHHKIVGEISRRSDKFVALSMFGSGSFWRREALEGVAALEEPLPIYLELWLPTIAHHLGYRVIGVDERQEQWVSSGPDRYHEIEAARKSGAWSLHPVKSVPTRLS